MEMTLSSFFPHLFQRCQWKMTKNQQRQAHTYTMKAHELMGAWSYQVWKEFLFFVFPQSVVLRPDHMTGHAVFMLSFPIWDKGQGPSQLVLMGLPLPKPVESFALIFSQLRRRVINIHISVNTDLPCAFWPRGEGTGSFQTKHVSYIRQMFVCMETSMFRKICPSFPPKGTSSRSLINHQYSKWPFTLKRAFT